MKEYQIKHGSIINFSSIASEGNPHFPHYSAAKAGVEGFTKSLAKEFGPVGIRVNCVQPGPIDTPMAKAQNSGNLIDKTIAAVPLKRIGKPEEVAELCLYLASDKSSYMSGAICLISGGLLIRSRI